MVKTILHSVLSVLLFSVVPAALQAQATTNLSAEGYYADPEIRVFAGQYWIYPTRSLSPDDPPANPPIPKPSFNVQQAELRKQHVIHEDYLLQTGLDAFSSPDLVHWTKHPSVLSVKDVPWAAYAIWAPSAIHLNGKYYLLFAANDIQKTDTFDGGIGVAVSTSPDGPFLDALGKPLIGSFHAGAQPIDPMIYQDDDGAIYLYYGGQGHCVVARLSSDLRQVIPMADGQLYKEITPAGYVEGPFMIKRRGIYYFMWSEGDWGGPDYGVAYGMSSSPTGPFRRAGKILSSNPAIAKGPGHHSAVQVSGTDQWYIVYHRHPLGTSGISKRVMAVDRMFFDQEGKIRPIEMTKAGPGKQAPSSPH